MEASQHREAWNKGKLVGQNRQNCLHKSKLAIMSAHLGFFPDFKSIDAVLWAGTSSDASVLVATIEQFVASAEPMLPLHHGAAIAKDNPVQLWLCKLAPTKKNDHPNTFYWLLSAGNLSETTDKLLTLVRSCKGHQYFELLESQAELIVSVGEYPDSWWGTDG